ncbi:MAG TPA: tRNA (adenosine(37)-N6)-threonylcarbamoyltransferase complex ATPase subunit type 1 TsaE [Gemmatimonadaceae bacterium]
MTHPPHHHVVPGLAAQGRIALTRDQLVAWGTDFGASARPPLVVAISGELGAGKTTLVQAICAGAGVEEPVTSPTFALVHRYHGATAAVYHLDLYRLGTPAELTNIGWDEIVNAHALVLIEWPERAGARLPPNTVPIDLEYDDRDADRRLLLAG